MTAITERIISDGHGALGGFTHIVIHETANPGATAQNHVDYWSRDDTYAVHAVCDWNSIFHTVPYDRLCWHVGNANGWTIGIEICHATNRADFLKAWDNALTWTKAMMRKFGIPASRVVSHDYCSRMWGGSDHDDPVGYFAEFGKTFQDFRDALAEAKSAPAQPRYHVHDGKSWRGGWKSCGQTAGGFAIYDVGFSGLPKGSWYQLKLTDGTWLGRNEHNLARKLPVCGIRVYYETANPAKTGWWEAVYRARVKATGRWLAWKRDVNTGGTGSGVKPLDAFQFKIREVPE